MAQAHAKSPDKSVSMAMVEEPAFFFGVLGE
jgi:hypothetical protein